MSWCSARRFAYVANEANAVRCYAIDPGTGALTEVGQVSARSRPMEMAFVAGASPVTVRPRFAYVANGDGDNVTTFRIDAATGALTEVGSEVLAGDGPFSVTVDPSGRFAYVASAADDNVTTFRIEADDGGVDRGGRRGRCGGPPAIHRDRRFPGVGQVGHFGAPPPGALISSRTLAGRTLSSSSRRRETPLPLEPA